MSNLTCAECGSVYSLEGVRNRDVFPCAVCGRAIVVPIAGPSAARAAGATRPPTTVERTRDEPPPIAPAPPAPAPASRPAAPPPRREAPSSRVRADQEEDRPEPHRMKSLVGLSHGLTALFALVVLVELVSIYGDWKAIQFLRESDRLGFDMQRAKEIDAANAQTAIVLLVVIVALAAVFCTWFYRAHSNLRAAKLSRLKYASGWAIGGFFVPFLNLVRPAQVMNEVWSRTTSLTGESRAASRRRPTTSPIVGWWWGLYICSGVLGNVSVRLTEPDQLVVSSWLSIVSSIASVVAAAAAVEIVRRVTAAQEWARTRRG